MKTVKKIILIVNFLLLCCFHYGNAAAAGTDEIDKEKVLSFPVATETMFIFPPDKSEIPDRIEKALSFVKDGLCRESKISVICAVSEVRSAEKTPLDKLDIEKIKKEAEENDLYAQFLMGRVRHAGIASSYPYDYNEAKKWYEKAGIPEAKCALAILHLERDWFPNDSEIKKLLVDSGKEGYAYAWYRLSRLYLHQHVRSGDMMDGDLYKKHKDYETLAAENGCRHALWMKSTYLLEAEGEFTEKKAEQYLRYIYSAALKNHDISIWKLSEVYKTGKIGKFSLPIKKELSIAWQKRFDMINKAFS